MYGMYMRNFQNMLDNYFNFLETILWIYAILVWKLRYEG